MDLHSKITRGKYPACGHHRRRHFALAFLASRSQTTIYTSCHLFAFCHRFSNTLVGRNFAFDGRWSLDEFAGEGTCRCVWIWTTDALRL